MNKRQIIITGVIIAFGVFGAIVGLVVSKSSLKSIGNLNPIVTVSPTPPVGNPHTLSIPKLNVSAPVESVGLDEENKMDVPIHAADVAYYNLGPKPGEIGNAVVAGHLDTVTGAPAVFYYLQNVKPGDEIKVADETGREYNFVVTDVKSYPFDQVPLNDIFGKSDKPKLNLITCEGTFNTATRNYSNRLVVYSEKS